MSPDQCRAARALLDWTQAELGRYANMSPVTIRSFEKGERTPIANNLSAIRRTFENAGIEFIGGLRPGVRWAKPRDKEPDE
ncbi:XRE family transcriptional regulator [Aureimonas flava]|uniref:XRE family transcriptional regulator n=1 Tax=Aureimonas flava TaxID=2320271 RepID=A0A3A1WE70_9HYPH|nr:helix-turn-helix transcriptional regulator [Aureimonas flava]RIX97184.1 XRE family transcriptional regulator [Aureimonas flava]